MPTTNPKISLYVPQQIYDHFKEFQVEQKLSMSQAGIVILAEYFGLKETIKEITEGTTVGGVTLAEFQELKNRLFELEKKVNFKYTTSSSLDKLEVEQKKSTSKPSKIESQSLDKTLDKNLETQSTKLKGEQLELLSDREIELISKELLAKRLGLKNSGSLSNKRREIYKNNNPDSDSEFYIWSQKKDFDGIGWKPVKQNNRIEYIPVGELSNELLSKLQKWIAKNEN